MAALLPTELWISIIKEVTHITAELNGNAVSLFDRPPYVETWKARLTILPTRRSLVRVSRFFYLIARPFLYQSILIRKGHTVELLARTLRETPYYGQWIRRFDVDLVRRKQKSFSEEALSDIMACLCNVDYLSACGEWPADLARTFIKSLRMCQNVRILCLQEHIFSESQLDYSPIFSLLGNLQVLYGSDWINTTSTYMSTPQKGRSIRHITPLSDWINPDIFSDPTYFPNVNTLTLRDDITISHFVRVHGYKITTVDFDLTYFQDLEGIGHYLPNLRNVIIDIESLEIEKDRTEKKFIAIPQVTRVGFTSYRTFSASWRIESALRLLVKLFPGIKHIQLLEAVFIRNLLRHKYGRILRWHKELKGKGIRLEREDRELLLWRNP